MPRQGFVPVLLQVALCLSAAGLVGAAGIGHGSTAPANGPTLLGSPASGLLAAGETPLRPEVPATTGPAAPRYFVTTNLSLGPPGEAPTDLLYVNSTGEIYATVQPSYVVVLSAASDRLIARVMVGADPTTLLYDPITEEVLVADTGSNSLAALNTTSHTLAATVALPAPPLSMGFDPSYGLVFVLTGPSGLVVVLDGTYYDIEATWITFAGFFGVGSLVVDTVTQEVYVTGYMGFSGYFGVAWARVGSYWTAGTIEGAGGGPFAFDPLQNTVFVLWYGEIEVLSATLHRVIANLTLGGASGVVSAIAYDSATQHLDAVTSSGAVYILNPQNFSTISVYPTRVQCPSALAPISGIAVDVADSCGDGITTVGLGTGAEATTPIAGGGPVDVAYDNATGDLVVANEAAGNLSIVSALTRSTVATVVGVPGAVGIAYDPIDSEVYVVGASGNVTVVSDRNWSVVARIALPLDVASPLPLIAYNPIDDHVYVAISNESIDQLGSTVYVISAETHRVIATIPVHGEGGPVTALAYVAPSGRVWVGGWDGWVATILPTNDTLVDLHYLAPSASLVSALTFNPVSGEVYASATFDGGANSTFVGNGVAVLNGSTGAASSVFPLPGGAGDLLFVSAQDDLFATNGTEVLSVVNAPSEEVAGAVFVGDGAGGMTWDESTGAVYVANSLSNSLTAVSPASRFPMALEETGLPAGASWNVSVAGTNLRTNAARLVLDLPNGSYAFLVSSPPGFAPVPASGVIVVNGTAVSRTIAFLATGGGGTPSASGTDPLVLGVATAFALAGGVGAGYLLGRRRPGGGGTGPPPRQ